MENLIQLRTRMSPLWFNWVYRDKRWLVESLQRNLSGLSGPVGKLP
jgi:hypothetical protein